MKPIKDTCLLVAGMALGLWAFATAAQATPTCKNGPIQLGAVSTVTGVVDFRTRRKRPQPSSSS